MPSHLLGRVRSWLSADAPSSPAGSAKLEAEPLETRETPTVSAISSNFNGTAIAAGNTLWFNSVAKVSGVPAAGATLHVTHQTVSFNGTTLSLPDSTIDLSPTTAATGATTAFAGGWQTNSPRAFSGNVFLGGVGFAVANTIPGGSVKSITWSGDFQSDTPGLTVNWKWAAAVYTNFSTDPGQLGVKPLDTATTQYPNSDHAGTPERFKGFVIGGARGGGGSNFTGSYSGTKSVVTDEFPSSSPAGVSGFAFQDTDFNGEVDAPLVGVTIELRDGGGNLVDATTTAADGSYSFTGLAAGVYTVAIVFDGQAVSSVGFVDGDGDGVPDYNQIGEINLAEGQFGVNYNFAYYPNPS